MGLLRNILDWLRRTFKPTPGRTPGDLFDLHNAARAEKSLPPLIIFERLMTMASDHAQAMARDGRMSHDQFLQRLAYYGIGYQHASENVAAGQTTPVDVMAGWMSSSGHRDNILGNFKWIGYGSATARDGTVYWCVVYVR
jgi:uncharacterized protein YkwD